MRSLRHNWNQVKPGDILYLPGSSFNLAYRAEECFYDKIKTFSLSTNSITTIYFNERCVSFDMFRVLTEKDEIDKVFQEWLFSDKKEIYKYYILDQITR